MRIEAALRGDLDKYLKDELKSAESAMMREMKEATDRPKCDNKLSRLGLEIGLHILGEELYTPNKHNP